MSFVIEDVEIEAEPCDHCGARPTEEDARKALREILKHAVCWICHGIFRFSKMTIHHDRGFLGDGKSFDLWRGYVPPDKERVEEVSLSGHTRNGAFVDIHAHLECLKKAIPGLRIQGGRT